MVQKNEYNCEELFMSGDGTSWVDMGLQVTCSICHNESFDFNIDKDSDYHEYRCSRCGSVIFTTEHFWTKGE